MTYASCMYLDIRILCEKITIINLNNAHHFYTVIILCVWCLCVLVGRLTVYLLSKSI